jgi:hypothetical protein
MKFTHKDIEKKANNIYDDLHLNTHMSNTDTINRNILINFLCNNYRVLLKDEDRTYKYHRIISNIEKKVIYYDAPKLLEHYAKIVCFYMALDEHTKK